MLDALTDQLRLIMDKSSCFDIFFDTKVNKQRMYNCRNVREELLYSIEIKKLKKQLKTIQLLKNIGIKMLTGYDNPLYIQLIQEEIKCIKQLFIFSIELGEETLIPKQLTQKDLSQCYKFYNPIMNIIDEMM